MTPAAYFKEFVQFVEDEKTGACWKDATYRAYDLEALTGLYTLTRALKALRRTELEIKDDLKQLSLPSTEVKGRLVRWYVWHRLATGELSKWPLRSQAGVPEGAHRPKNHEAPDSPA